MGKDRTTRRASPITLRPLDFDEAVEGLLGVPTKKKPATRKKAAGKRKPAKRRKKGKK